MADLSRLSAADKKRLLEALRAKEIAKCADSFEYFLFTWVRTADPHDKENPVKPVPRKDYLVFLAREFDSVEEPVYVAKSRQLMVSWLLSAKTVHEILFRPYSWVCFQSKKESDAAEMIYDTVPNKARASFIMANLPDWMQVCIAIEGGERKIVPFTLDQRTFSYGTIVLPNGSRANALAQGAAQIESKVPSLFISDESSLQEEWSESWAAAMPCLSGGGRAIAVATMRLPSAYGEEIRPCDEVDPDGVMRGVARFKTARGGYGLRIHYSADPEKDPLTEAGAAWHARETTRMEGGEAGTQWQQHMEINPESLSGTPAIPYWDKIKDAVVIDDIPAEIACLWSLSSGFDWGARNKTVWKVFAHDFEGNKYLVHELAFPAKDVANIPGSGGANGITGIANLMKCSPYFERVNGRIQADPTIWNDDQNTPGAIVSKAKLFELAGVRLVPAKANGQDADDVLLNRLHGLYWAGYESEDFVPRYFICRSCRETIAGIPRLRYQDHKGITFDQNALKEKLVDRQNDWWDCYDDKTDILTRRGWVRFSALRKSDKVGTWVDGELVFQKPKAIIAKPHIGEMLLHENTIDFCVTPTHYHFVANQMSVIRRKSPVFNRKRAAALDAVEWAPRVARWKGKRLKSPIKGVPVESLIAFIGFYLAEGSREKNKPHLHVDQKNPDDELLAMLDSLGIPYWKTLTNKRENQWRFTFSHKELAALLPHGPVAHTKRIPRWVLEGTPEQLMILIGWMMRGDGSKKLMRYNTVSKGLADDFQEAVFKAGFGSSVQKQDARFTPTPLNRYTCGRAVYHVYIHGGRRGQGGGGELSNLGQIKKRNTKRVPYVGMVYCVATEAGVVAVRRNGRIMFSGNSEKYAEVSTPMPAAPLRAEDKPLSFAYLLRLARRELDKHKNVRS